MTQRIDSTTTAGQGVEPPLTLRIAAALQFLIGLRLLGSGVVWAARTHEAAAVSAGQGGASAFGVMAFGVVPVAAGLAALAVSVAMSLRAHAWTWGATLVLQVAYGAVVIPTTLLEARTDGLTIPSVLHAVLPSLILLLLFAPASLRCVLRGTTRAGE